MNKEKLEQLKIEVKNMSRIHKVGIGEAIRFIEAMPIDNEIMGRILEAILED